MPLPVAHGLLGASVVAAVMPPPVSLFSARCLKPLLIGAFLAITPDFDFLLVFALRSDEWHRGFTHSIMFALIVGLFFVLYFGRRRFREVLAYGLAFASHFVLDFATTTSGGGVELFSPFSDERFALRWFGLSEIPSKLVMIEVLKALSVEFIIFFFLLIVVLFIKNGFDLDDAR